MPKPMQLLAGFAFTMLLAASPVAAETPHVVASIKPVHSLAAFLMQGVGSPELIVTGAASPHDAALKPSQAAAIAEADLVFWVGPQLEAFLAGPLAALTPSAKAVALSQASGLTLLPLREGGLFEAHEDEDHGGAGDGQGHEADEEHDAHIWLDPENAKAMARLMASELADADPDHRAIYDGNLRRLEAEIDTLIVQTGEALKPLNGRPYVVFHDAYQYFEQRFDLPAAGSITLNPEVAPGAERVARIRQRVANEQVVCVFSEPQFAPKIVTAILDGTGARTAALDPLGAALSAGPQLYFELIRAMTASVADCLAAR